jgi:hypothetical protein
VVRDRLTCRDVVELATEYFEASLPAATNELFAAHVAGCRGCQQYLRQMRITVDAARTTADPPAGDAM